MGAKISINFKDLILNSNDWIDLHHKLIKLGADKNKEKVKGDTFEEIARLYLLTNATYSTKLKEVWHHKDIPQNIIDELGLQKPEVGVDLIAKTKDGLYWAIQCKYHSDENKNVQYQELRSFFGITEREKTYQKLSHRLVFTSANQISKKVSQIHGDKLGFITSSDLKELKKIDFDIYKEFLRKDKYVLNAFTPYQHQQRAIKNVVKYFQSENLNRGKIIHPCGSGKSLTGFWISQILKAKTILIAVPSLALVKQVLNTWARESLANNLEMDWIAVCSDDDVKKQDDAYMQCVDLGIEVNTNPLVINNFLKRPTESKKVVVTTYQSGNKVCESLKNENISFDLGIFDEAHKTVGGIDKKFALLLFEKNISIKKRIFMTATEKQFKGNSDEYLSMNDKAIYGEIIDFLSFKDALESKPPILSDYKVITLVVKKSEIKAFLEKNEILKSNGVKYNFKADTQTIASLIAYRKLCKRKIFNHTVSFHKSIKRANEFKNLNNKVNSEKNLFNYINSFHVNGAQSTGIRKREIDRFLNVDYGLITNSRCLTEGVDIPKIDSVIFADPKQSKIDIVQATGRALRIHKDKSFGYVIVPVILDEQLEDSSNDVFKQVINVISALGMSDERIIEEFREISKGNKPDDPIVIIEEEKSTKIEFKNFVSELEIQIWNRLSFGWYIGYEKLKAYYLENKTSLVPHLFKTKDGFGLGSWVASRRRKKDRLTDEQISLLEAFHDWSWGPLLEYFEKGLKELLAYQKEYGDMLVPRRYKTKDGFPLGSWVAVHRGKRLSLNSEQRKILDDLENWVWVVNDGKFEKGFKECEQFISEKGHCIIPVRFKTKNGFNLGNWARMARRRGIRTYTKSQIERLNNIGFEWKEKFDTAWEENINEVKDFFRENGHINIKRDFFSKSGKDLGMFIINVRKRKQTLSEDRIKELDDLGMIWDTADAKFKKGIEKFIEYQKTYKNSRVAFNYESPDGYKLGNWVRNVRVGKIKVTNENKLILDKLDFLWDLEGQTYHVQ